MVRFLDFVHQILLEAGRPLQAAEISEIMNDQELWNSDTTSTQIRNVLSKDMRTYGDRSRFIRVEDGVFSLNPAVEHKKNKRMTYTRAAKKILTAENRPMHYQEITERALQMGILETSSKAPPLNLFSAIQKDIIRARKKGKQPTFAAHRGYISLTAWKPEEPDFGSWMIDQLAQRDQSQFDLAQQMGVSEGLISGLINGKVNLSIRVLQYLAAAWNLTDEEILKALKLSWQHMDSRSAS